MREVASKAARNLEVVSRAGKSFNFPRVLRGCFNAYVSSSLEYCVPVWILSMESHLCLLDGIVRRAEKLCEGKFCLRHRRKGTALCWLYKIYHRVDHHMNEYLDHFVSARNTRASAALGELALVFTRCRTDQFSRSFLPAAVRLWN